MVNVAANPDVDYYYMHDHLYSPVALLAADGTVAERYEYNAYGRMTRLNYNFTTFSGSQAGNPYYFTGRSMDTLDGENSLEIMYYRNRYYKPSIGRWLSNDPLGMMSNTYIGGNERFSPTGQYKDVMNLYEYVQSNSITKYDPYGLELEMGDPAYLDWQMQRDGVCAPWVGGVKLPGGKAKEFWDWLEWDKKQNGIPPGKHYSNDELKEKIKEWNDQGQPAGPHTKRKGRDICRKVCDAMLRAGPKVALALAVGITIVVVIDGVVIVMGL
jgi:RHS repeat-associated protein